MGSTDDALRFIEANHEGPFIVYLAHHTEYAVAFAKTPCSMIRNGDYKLIHYFGDYLDPEGCIPKGRTVSGRFVPGERTELFDLAEDLGESRDLAPEMPEKVAELRACWGAIG